MNYSTFAAFDGYARRLRESRNRTERRSIYWGYTVNHQYPVLIPLELLFEHAHILGGTGTGKTALGLMPLSVQLVRRNDGPVIVLDLKGDMALFNTVRLEAEAAGRKFKWFTNKPYRSTYIFNPWQQAYLDRMTIQEVLGLFLLSLNMHHGDDYGRGYFTLSSRTLLQVALQGQSESYRRRNLPPPTSAPESFIALHEEVRRLARNREEHRNGEHLLHVLKSLVDIPQLNLSPNKPDDDAAARHAIHMPEVVRDKQVVYFWLQALTDLTTVSEIARLALYSAVMAALAYREETGKKPRVFLICDEAQNLVAQNVANVLAQAREHGVSCVLAHQSMSQLNPPGGIDLRDLVMSCTTIKQFWSAREPELRDYISKISGEVGYYDASWARREKA